MTLSKLAKLANVSISTASKAFSNSKEISDSTREHIFAIAKKEGCFDKYYRERFEKKVIAIIAPELKSVYYTNLLTTLEFIFSKQNMKVLISITNFSKKEEITLIQYYLQYVHVDGLIIINGGAAIQKNTNIPVVYIGPSEEAGDADCVDVNEEEAVNDAIRLFKNNGHKKISFIGETLTYKRENFFKSAMKNQGMRIYNEYIFNSKQRFEPAGYASMEKIFSMPEQPTAILSAYSYITQGIIQSILEHNKSIPDDFSIISMDDLLVVPYSKIDLTCIGMHTNEICRIAADVILKKIDNPNFTAKQHIVLYKKLFTKNSVKIL